MTISMRETEHAECRLVGVYRDLRPPAQMILPFVGILKHASAARIVHVLVTVHKVYSILSTDFLFPQYFLCLTHVPFGFTSRLIYH